jgi:photosystem II stability/assembly factor-like uncharacterized protein
MHDVARSTKQVVHGRTSTTREMRIAVLLAAPLLMVACASSGGTSATGQPALEEQTSGSAELLQAVSVVDPNVVWVSGQGGSWGRTTDGGRTWRVSVMRGADSLEFRDVHAASATTAWLLAAGPGERSRIYRTTDAGATWTEQWVNREAQGFYDCMDFWDERRGFVYGDAVDGGLRILVTADAGASWTLVPSSSLPPALQGEGGFAASGTCALTGSGGRAWIAAGNAPRARVFWTSDYGRSWQAADAPVVAGEAAGLTSIAMIDETRGIAFGGHLGEQANTATKVARTQDGGRTWSAVPGAPVPGAIYGGVSVPETGGRTFVVVGPGGSAISRDGGNIWSGVDTRAWWGVGSGGPDATWITGPQGRIARLRLR